MKKRGSIRRPIEVTQATQLLWVSLVAGMIVSLLDIFFLGALVPLDFTLMIVAVFVITAVLILQIFHGKNWARYVLLSLVVLGLIPYMLNLVSIFDRSITMGLLSLLQLVVQIVALYLIFSPNSSAWFRRKSAVHSSWLKIA